MNDQTPAPAPVEMAAPVTGAVAAAIAAERERAAAIMSAAGPHLEAGRLSHETVRGLLTGGAAFEEARTAMMAEMAADQPPVSRITRDERETAADALIQGFAARIGRRVGLRMELSGPGREFLDAPESELGGRIAMAALRLRGETVRSEAEAVRRFTQPGQTRMFTGPIVTSWDFPGLMGAGINLTVQRILERQPSVLRQVTHNVVRRTFDGGTHLGLEGADALTVAGEAGEPRYVYIGENAETLPGVQRYAGLWSATDEVTRKFAGDAGIDLAAATTRAIVESAYESERNVIRAAIAEAGWTGRTMQNTRPVFNVTDRTLASGPSAINLTSLGNGFTDLARMVDGKGIPRPVIPRFLLCAPEQRVAAEQHVAAIAAAKPVDVNPFSGNLEVLTDPAIDSGRWFLIGDPSSYDGLAFSFLEDMAAPRLEFRDSWPRFGWEMRVQWPIAATFVRRSWWQSPA